MTCSIPQLRGSRETCENLYTENLLESFLRSRTEVIQLRKLQGICFNKVAPCRRPRSNYCDLTPARHAHGYVESDPAFYEQFNMDYFLTGSAVNADFDGQFAVRLARFFRDDVDRAARRSSGPRIFQLAGRPARPARVLDMGCGRGSYVELFERWGLVAIGVDGDVVVRRTLPKSSLVWDLTEPLDLPGIRTSEAEGFLSLIPEGVSVDGVDGTMDLFLSQIETAADGDQASGCSFEAPDDPTEEEDANLILSVGLKMEGTGGHHSVALLRHICCSDVRCVGYGMGVSHPPIGTVWRMASSQGEDPYNGTRPSFFYGLRYLRRKTWPSARGASGRVALPHSLLENLGVLTVSFGSADWVLSLGVGQFIPRSKEPTFLMNLVRHAELGIVILWGGSGPNPRSAKEVRQLFQPLGFRPDKGAARELRLFAGLAYGGQKDELLVLRRRAGTWAALDPWSREDVHNADGSGEPAALVGHHAYLVQYRGKQAVHCAVHETYGLVRPGLLWVTGGCGGLFRVWRTNNAQELPGAFCINADHRYKECIIPSWLTDPKINATVLSALMDLNATGGARTHLSERLDPESPGLNSIQEWSEGHKKAEHAELGKQSPGFLDWQMHASADHFVPRLAAWRGDPRLNVVFYKFSRKLASACVADGSHCTRCNSNSTVRTLRAHTSTAMRPSELLLEWRWFWSIDWRPLLRLSAQLQARRGRGWRGRGGVEAEAPTRFARLFLVLRSLGLKLSKRDPKDLKDSMPGFNQKLRTRALGHFRRAASTAESTLRLQVELASKPAGEAPGSTPKALKVRWSASDCLPRWRFRRDRKKLKGPPPPEALLRRFALAQRAGSALLAGLSPARALRSPVLHELLGLAHRAALAVAQWGGAIPCTGQRFRKRPMSPVSHRPMAKPGCERCECERPWAEDSVEAWYVYRLVACDPSV